jgi:2,3-bisphosphoglycerate-dependent phosphoglycerate mutase
MTGPVRLVLLRHGQSEWNAAGIFAAGRTPTSTAHGEAEAARAGSMLAEHGVLPAFVHTSLQQRTIRTADHALAAADRDWIPVRRSWRLNGRALRSAARPEQERGASAVRRPAVSALACARTTSPRRPSPRKPGNSSWTIPATPCYRRQDAGRRRSPA